jgi:hypothetical protein
MKAKLGDLGQNLLVLRNLRDSLVHERKHKVTRSEVEEERWNTFSRISGMINGACEDRDLSALVSSIRDMKNKLRRPGVRKALERLEARDKPKVPKKDDSSDKDDSSQKDDSPGKEISPGKKKDNPTGECKCSACGKVIDGSKEPCVDDALCVKCALKSKVISKKDQDAKKAKKVGPPIDPGMGGGGGGVDGGVPAEDEQPKESRRLRRRGYMQG